MTAHPRADGCPECATRDNHPHTTHDVPNGAQCAYTCHACGCQWETSWWEGAT